MNSKQQQKEKEKKEEITPRSFSYYTASDRTSKTSKYTETCIFAPFLYQFTCFAFSSGISLSVSYPTKIIDSFLSLHLQICLSFLRLSILVCSLNVLRCWATWFSNSHVLFNYFPLNLSLIALHTFSITQTSASFASPIRDQYVR